MKKLILCLIIAIFLMNGCTSSEDTSTLNSVDKPVFKAICGNGIQEEGESYETCCLDVECPDFFECKELKQGTELIYTCVKQKLEDTKDYQNFLECFEEECREYMKERDLVNYEYVLAKINRMNQIIEKLSPHYDVSIEKLFVQYRYSRRDWNVKVNELEKKLKNESEEKKTKEILSKLIGVCKDELDRLSQYSAKQITKIDEIFDYDILENIATLKGGIATKEEALEWLDKKVEIKIELIDYNPTCSTYSTIANTCYLDYVKIHIENTGELPLEYPTFDFYILKGDAVISRDIDESSYTFEEIPVGYDGVYKNTRIGYNDGEKLSKGDYTLKIDLKRGISTTVISTLTAPIKLR